MKHIVLGTVLVALALLHAVTHDEWREELVDARGALEWLDNVNDKLRAENAKLRELVAEYRACSRQVGCDRCGYRDECDIDERMRALGVEVDE